MATSKITNLSILDDAVRTAGIQDAAVTAAKTSGIPARPNAQPFIINGGMEVNQRTGTTATAFTNNVYGIDRWLNFLNGSWAGNYQQIDRSNSVVTDLQTDSSKNFDNVMMIDCTSAASLGATDLVGMLQHIEGYVHNPMAGKAITLSFWVRSTVTGTYCVAFKEQYTKTYVVEYTISSANTWEQKIITLTDDTLANYSSNTSTTNGGSLILYFGLRLGTTAQQTTADAWNTGNFYGTSNQVTWGTSTSDFFYLAGVQIEMGTYTSSTIPPFQFESYRDNLSRCQRYYHLVGTAVGGAANTVSAYMVPMFWCPMRTTPTAGVEGVLSVNDPAVGNITQSSASVTLNSGTPEGCFLTIPNLSGITANDPILSRFLNSNKYQFAAEI